MSMYEYPIYKPSPRLTVLICAPDVHGERAARNIRRLTDVLEGTEYRLVISDNRHQKGFRHGDEINRALQAYGTPLLTLDDDVTVTPGFLDAMQAAATPDVGIVACSVYRPQNNKLWSRALWFDSAGKVFNWRGEMTEPQPVPAACSCCWLITDPGVRMSNSYGKYYFDPDACFRTWNRGRRVVVVPHKVYHEGAGATNDMRLDVARQLKDDRATFRQTWIDSGWMDELKTTYGGLWPEGMV